MKFGVSLLVVIVILLLAGVLPVGGGDASIVFTTPVLIALLGVLAVLDPLLSENNGL